jgi:hypothetical protein
MRILYVITLAILLTACGDDEQKGISANEADCVGTRACTDAEYTTPERNFCLDSNPRILTSCDTATRCLFADRECVGGQFCGVGQNNNGEMEIRCVDERQDPLPNPDNDYNGKL